MQTNLFPEQAVLPPYRVLARKYRPTTFGDMIGQETIVQIFSNAIGSGRIAHAFLLTGIRGVGKTTTARIMARALNCIGAEQQYNSPTIYPCGVCQHCVAISGDRHQDIIEIDAASHTGVADMREIIENVKYKPVTGRYKVYIIDEVHMLSNSAFNALLKTLEEPPAHTKFILATTEVRKIPATILSRCQRFDLRRVEQDVLQEYFLKVAGAEGIEIESSAAGLIAAAASGSVRDGLSILDQAIALSDNKVLYAKVCEMLGLTDLEARLELFVDVARGDVAKVIESAAKLYHLGGDPVLLLQDMLGVVHQVTKIKVLSLEVDKLYPPQEAEKYGLLAQKLSLSFLNRAWQIITRGIDEVKSAYSPFSSFEMVLIRLIHSSMLPSVEELLRKVETSTGTTTLPSTVPPSVIGAAVVDEVPTKGYIVEDILQLCLDHEELMLHHHLFNDASIVRLQGNDLLLQIKQGAPVNLLRQLQEFLQRVTCQKWSVTSDSSGEVISTIHQRQQREEEELRRRAVEHPLVQKVLGTFPELEVAEVI